VSPPREVGRQGEALSEAIDESGRRLRDGSGPGDIRLALIDLRREALKAEAQLAQVERALREIHEYHCGCDTPGQLDRCVAQPVVPFAALHQGETE